MNLDLIDFEFRRNTAASDIAEPSASAVLSRAAHDPVMLDFAALEEVARESHVF